MSHLTVQADSSELTLPDLNENHLQIEFLEPSSSPEELNLVKMYGLLYPQAAEGVYKASVVENRLMTEPDSAKACYDLKFKIESGHKLDGSLDNDLAFVYEPGQAVDIVCANSVLEVTALLERLNLADKAESRVGIKSLDETKKLGQAFVRLSQATTQALTLRNLFLHCVDIRTNSLKKSFLRMLAEYSANTEEKMHILHLASKEGSDTYTSLIKENFLSLLDLLNMFKSCQPPLAHLLQMLPTLNPRPYSFCTCSADSEIEVIFNLVEFNVTSANGRTYPRQGFGTGFLSALASGQNFYFLKRKFHTFTFPPAANNKPVVMIGPGTGVAPFISYLRHIDSTQSSTNSKLWLFFGCRDPEKDFLFRNELCQRLSKHLDKLSVSFSRFSYESNKASIENQTELVDLIERYHVPQGSKYVQDSLKFYAKDLTEMICDKEGFVYVCGDAKNMSKDVFSCLSECLKSERGLSDQEAIKYLNEMIKNQRYKQDIWA